jgi:hypothetical protein
MKFGAFQRSKGKLNKMSNQGQHGQPLTMWTPQAKANAGRPSRAADRPAPLCIQPGQVLRGNISPYGGKKESKEKRSVCPQHPADLPHVAMAQPLCSTASSPIFTT